LFTSGDASQPLAYQKGVHEDAGFEKHIREPTIVRVIALTVVSKANPPVRDKSGKPLLRLHRKRRWRLGGTAQLRSVDSKQPDAAEAGDVDRIAVDHVPDQNEIRGFLRSGGN
jgi:hypothetical protein